MIDPEGVIYSGKTPDGRFHLGFIVGDDIKDYDDLQSWHKVLDALSDPPGLALDSLHRGRMSDFSRISR